MKANFHTHTYRCNHALGDVRDYVDAAVQAGFAMLGMSDHTPWPGDAGVGMRLDQLPGYVQAIRAAQAEHAGTIVLKAGLECEYSRKNAAWLRDTIAEWSLDYVILGNHFSSDADDPVYFGALTDRSGIQSYLRSTVEGLETGMYAYLAHPELYLRAYPQWDAAAEDVARALCRACHALRIPVEYNLEGVRARRRFSQSGIGYPNRHFWEVAAEEGCTAIIGYDAHMPESLLDDSDFEAARQLIEAELGMQRIDSIF